MRRLRGSLSPLLPYLASLTGLTHLRLGQGSCQGRGSELALEAATVNSRPHRGTHALCPPIMPRSLRVCSSTSRADRYKPRTKSMLNRRRRCMAPRHRRKRMVLGEFPLLDAVAPLGLFHSNFSRLAFFSKRTLFGRHEIRGAQGMQYRVESV